MLESVNEDDGIPSGVENGQALPLWYLVLEEGQAARREAAVLTAVAVIPQRLGDE
jgi:hypothetical protein